VDPIIIALPLSILTLVLVSALTKASDPQHLRRCFPQEQGR
jgi:SSS family solute:Na+ symporter